MIRSEDVESLVATLADRPGRFFVFPDWTLLYGVLGRPAPQPFLWFHEGLTHRRGPPSPHSDRGRAPTPSLDRWIVAELERNAVRTVVLERVSWLGTRSRLAGLPDLASYLERCFERIEVIGMFALHARRLSAPSRCPAGPDPEIEKPR